MKKYRTSEKTKSCNLLFAVLLISFLLNSKSIRAQDNEGSKVKWMSLTEAMEKVKKDSMTQYDPVKTEILGQPVTLIL